ncbi:histidine kinase (plasmid) [Kitasatospora sp. NBC_00070]|uniref:sensor histidine kinase n=1 Tax=Kitasatospora sp. NBC_00070 TaxID=2975962 RepID=UPI002F91A60C
MAWTDRTTPGQDARRQSAGPAAGPHHRGRPELLALTARPLRSLALPHAWRYLPHALVILAAALMLVAGITELTSYYRLSQPAAMILATADSATLLLALYAPVAAWWLSLGLFAATAALQDTPQWPWPALIIQLLLLLLLSLQVRPRAAATALAITTAATLLARSTAAPPAQRYDPYSILTIALFAFAVITGSLLHVSRQALLRLTAVAAEERAHRVLLEERGRIARELHDVIAHHMSVISIQAQVAPHLVPHPTDELLRNLAGIRGNALEALNELRRVLGLLRFDTSDPQGPEAPQPTLKDLGRLVENVRTTGTTITVKVTGTPTPPPPGVEVSAYRIVQEALSNALRHAPGASVRLRIEHQPGALLVEVSNGLAQRATPPSAGAGHGLLGMRERVAMLDGTLSAGPTAEGGYTVTAHLPTGPPTSTSQEG